MQRSIRQFWHLGLLVIVLAGLISGAHAQDVAKALSRAPFLLSADTVIYDNDTATVIAKGNVEISSEDRVLLADRVEYDQRSGTVRAEGNITLLEPTGEVAFAERLELDAELKSGFIQSIRILLTDKSRFAANNARRDSPNRTVLERAIYSPCEVCKEDPNRPLVWQIKAARVIHRRAERSIEYQDAFLEVFGIPVAYTPFFRHPDPTVKRKSGFLSPKVGSTTDLGATVQVPYFWAIADDKDATFEPIFTSNEGVVLAGEYRAALAGGGYELYGTGTRVDKRNDQNQRLDDKVFRGHLEGNGRFEIDPGWRWGFDLSRSTDDTYLKRYRISDADVLTSDVFLEGTRGRNYAAVSAYTFQGLEANDRVGETPYVAPLLDYSWIDGPFNGTTLQIDANAVSLYRTDGADTRRLSVDGEMRYPHVGRMGDVYTFIGRLDTDVYVLNDFNTGVVAGATDNANEMRMFPLAAIDWRYPWVRQDKGARLIIEPIAQLVATPYGGNPSDIPNEDSQSIEFDDSNLFSLNRFPGWDRVESGPRANAGVKLAAYGDEGGYISAVAGQVLRVKNDDTFARESGLDKSRSDVVAGATIVPNDYIDLTYRTRLDASATSIALRRNELYLSFGPKDLRVAANYLRLDRDLSVNGLQEREEVYNSLRWNFSQFWTLTASSRRDLTGDGRQIRTGAGLEYQDECIGLFLTYDRDFTRDRDVEPSTSINFRIVLKHLG